MQPNHAARRAEEDIDSVLTRFQTWTSAQVPEAGGGIREISHDEALRSAGYQRRRLAEKTFRTAGTNTSSGPAAPSAAPGLKPPPLKPEPEITERSNSRSKEKPDVATAAAKKKTLPASPETFKTALTQTVASPISDIVSGANSRPQAKPTKDPRISTRAERRGTISVHFSHSERALVKLHAAAEGLSASAYLRKCAFDVELLRAQVQQFVEAAARSRLAELSASAAAPPIIKNENWLARWHRRLWREKSTQLSLHA